MKAIVQDRYGSSDSLRVEEVDRPSPAAGEVLVRVRAASVNARDWHLMRGDPYLARLMARELRMTRPRDRIRGTDFAGRVEAVGPGVTRLKVGDDVYGEADRAFAEYVCAGEGVDLKPTTLTYEEAAAVPLAGNTALIGVRDLAEVRPGQQVLINGASGGVGPFAVQLATMYGAEVTAVCRARNAELVRSLGADHVVDYTRDDFTLDAGRYDVVFDLVGNRSLADLRRALRPAGTLVLSGGGTSNGGSLVGPMGLTIKGALAARFVRQRLFVLVAKPSVENLAALRGFIDAGHVRPVVDRTFPFADAPAAIRYLELEHARAKVIITLA